MADNEIQASIRSDISLILEFKRDIQRWFDDLRENPVASAELRSKINRTMLKVESVIDKASCAEIGNADTATNVWRLHDQKWKSV